jgi:ornithine carbamoyltransferase
MALNALNPVAKVLASRDVSHFLSGCELSRAELQLLINDAESLRVDRVRRRGDHPLAGHTLALIFEKPSLRTRVSFTVAMSELGGSVIELNAASLKKEEPEDTIRVLGGYCDAVMMRTFSHHTLERMASISQVPVINGLSDLHHPCQAMADLLTLKQEFDSLRGLKLAYIGDGNNVLHSLMLLAPLLGVEVNYACPAGYQPNAEILAESGARAMSGGTKVNACVTPEDAVAGANAVYTDVWTSMGFEDETQQRDEAFKGYQLNEALYAHADRNAIVMHCLPMVRGKEISDAMADHKNSRLFQQSENRLHVQKALLKKLLVDTQFTFEVPELNIEERRQWR